MEDHPWRAAAERHFAKRQVNRMWKEAILREERMLRPSIYEASTRQECHQWKPQNDSFEGVQA